MEIWQSLDILQESSLSQDYMGKLFLRQQRYMQNILFILYEELCWLLVVILKFVLLLPWSLIIHFTCIKIRVPCLYLLRHPSCFPLFGDSFAFFTLTEYLFSDILLGFLCYCVTYIHIKQYPGWAFMTDQCLRQQETRLL